MKILQVNKLYYPWVGGVEQHVKDLSQGLVDNGHDVLVLAVSETEKQKLYFDNGVQVFKLANHVFKFMKKVLLFSMPVNLFFPFYLKSKSKNRIMHFHLPNPLAVMSFFMLRPKGKIVVMWHSDIVKQKFFLKLYRPFLNLFLKKADVILATSPNMIANSVFLRRFKEKCQVMHLGIDPAEYILDKEDYAEVTSFKSNLIEKELLFVGRLTYYKGVFVLIESMRNVNAHLTIIGEGYLKNECIELIEKYNLHDKVTILPFQNKKTLVKWFHKCDLFVLPSIAPSEAFGIVQLEAMICKKPVISTNLPTGVPYVNQDGFSGLVVEPGNVDSLAEAINHLVSDENLMNKYGSQGYNRVLNEFTNSKMIEKIETVYEKLRR